jgi:hypothetical protein
VEEDTCEIKIVKIGRYFFTGEGVNVREELEGPYEVDEIHFLL